MEEPKQPTNGIASMTEEGRYRLLVDSVFDYAIYMLDAGGFVTSWNLGAQRFKGYERDEIVGEHFSRFYIDEDRASGLPERALSTAAREGRFEAEGWRQRKDGSRFWAHVIIDAIRDPDGALIGYAKVTRDLSERRAAEQALRHSQEQFRRLVEGVTDYAIFMLDAQGLVSSWNSGAQRIKGYRPDEIIGRHFSTFYRPEDREQNQPTRALETAAREGRFESEGWRVRKDGSHFWANVVIDPIRDDAGAIIGYAKVTRDVTEKRATQHALERARESLFHSQKLDAIGQLTGGVAHDFNNLLMVILSSLELIDKRIGDDPRLSPLLDNAIKGAQRGAALTQRMLAFARQQDLKPVAVDVVALVDGMSDMMQRSLGPAIGVSIELPAGLPPIRVDPNQLELALLNLAVNARDALPHGGRLTISASDETVGSGRNDLAAGRYVRLVVRDDGEGMDEATLARATEPFFTTKGVGKGTGLGLSMVDGLASQSGGRFVLASRKGEGTTAEIWLPVASPSGEAQARAPAAAPANAQALDILVVDDDGLVLDSTVAILEELGHRARSAASAREALEVLEREAGVQVVLTDHAMPQMSGAQLAGVIRARWPATGVVLASGYAEIGPDIPPGVVKIGKPFSAADLERAVGAAARGA